MQVHPKVEWVDAVIAKWCPHCYPLSIENAKKLAEGLKVPLRVLDIDLPNDAAIADWLVRDYGDNVPDYLIPQIFLEFDDGKIMHVFTGFSENTEITKRRWHDLLSSSFYSDLKKVQES